MRKFKKLSVKAKSIAAGSVAIVTASAVAVVLLGHPSVQELVTADKTFAATWPTSFAGDDYEEPDFKDVPGRTNNAFNVADFGEQGSNGWFYRYGDADHPQRSHRMESFDGEKYFVIGATGLEMKKDFCHTADQTAPILEWRAAEDGVVNVNLTYVKNVNGDKNPSFPDGVKIAVYKGEEMLFVKQVEVSTEKDNLLETSLKDLDVKTHESLYFVVDPMSNNAYDGGSLYVSIHDKDHVGTDIEQVESRSNNNASIIDDFGEQGKNGWCYLYGEDVEHAKFVSDFANDTYMNETSPNLTFSQFFVHPSLNHNAIYSWTPAVAGTIDLDMKYTKFEQHDGNPKYPDGVTVEVYRNDEKLYSKQVNPLDSGNVDVYYSEKGISVKPTDRLYFVVCANENASYDGGHFDIRIADRNGSTDESDVYVDETSETRQNFADTKYDFGEQGNNGWIYQEGKGDDPFGCYNMTGYDAAEDRYMDDSFLEIKRDFVNTGKGKSAVIKWKVAQDGAVRIKAAYTKLLNEDSNPSYPDGTRVSIYYNNQLLKQEEFAPNREEEITKRLDVDSVDVKAGGYITMVVNGKENNAYDGGKYEFAIESISPLVGETENDVKSTAKNNNASVMDHFGKQGTNGFYYQYGYYQDPFYAVNVERCENGEKYFTNDGIEIKKDFIMPGNKGRAAIVKWVAPQKGEVNVGLVYNKLMNEDANPSWPDGVQVTLFKNSKVLRTEYFAPDTEKEVSKDLSVKKVKVKPGDCITFMVDGLENTAYDGGTYRFTIEDAKVITTDEKNDSEENIASLKEDFGDQGSNGWYYLEGASLAEAEVLTVKTEDGFGYKSRKQDGLELKSDFVQPRLGSDAIYQWVVAKDGYIDVYGDYTKFGHNDPNVSWPDGTNVSIYLNQKRLSYKKVGCKVGEGNDTVYTINFSKLKVKAGDKISFMIGANENVAWDGGRLAIQIRPYKKDRNNETVLKDDFGAQGENGWNYGMCDWDGANFELLEYDEAQGRYYNNGKPELKADYVEPGNGRNAAYRWTVGKNGVIRVKGKYTKYANAQDPEANGTCMRIFINGVEKKWMGTQGNFATEKSVEFDEYYEVHKGDVVMFAIDCDGNDSLDGGCLSVRISEGTALPEPEPEPEPEPAPDPVPSEDPENPRENQTTLRDDFGTQGLNGWSYGTCEWNGANFELLTYDETNQQYAGDGYPCLKKDYVEPKDGKAGAYRWKVAKDGTVRVQGQFVQKANSADPNANGTCMRIFINGVEKKWMGAEGNYSDTRTCAFDEVYEVHEGDIIMFGIDACGNDSYDGGSIEIMITPVL